MKYSIITFLILSLTLCLTSCKNKLEVFAPGAESVSVYGILNPNQSTQKIRINKVYLTNGDALTAGQDNSQINYGAGELTVTLQRFINGSTTPTLTTRNNSIKKEILLTETVVTTSDGSFSTGQRLWQTNDRLLNTGEYKLTIKNNSTGAVFTAQTLIMDSVRSYGAMPFIYYQNPNPSLAFPVHGQYITNGGPGSVTADKAYVDYSVTGNTARVKFKSVANAKLYNLVLRFNYIDSLIGGGTINQFVDLNFPTISSNGLAGGEELEFSFPISTFYTNAAAEISKKTPSNLKNRRAFYLEYIVTTGAESLSDFLQINAPSNSIAQNKPNYTNISGGVGIFSSRSTTNISKDLFYNFINNLACNPATISLSFCDSDGKVRAVACPQ